MQYFKMHHRTVDTNANVNTGSDTLIVSFAGHDKNVGGVPRFEFFRFLEREFPDVDRHFYMDSALNMYHSGIQGLTRSVDETVEHLRNEIVPYKKVVFIGSSSGGYAAILFGSLLQVQSVVAFIPQTVIRKKRNGVNEKYRDLLPHMNGTTRYYLFGNTSIEDCMDCHHISHCERVEHLPNVLVTKQKRVDLRAMRDSGRLHEALTVALTQRVAVAPVAPILF